MPMPPFIVHAHSLSPGRQAEVMDEKSLLAALRDDAPAWVHLDGRQEGVSTWLSDQLSYLEPQAVQALLDATTRARAHAIGEGMILILRLLNDDEGEDPEDMVSVRMWVDAHRIVSISLRPLQAITHMDEALSREQGPSSSGEFLSGLVKNITHVIAEFQSDLDQVIDDLEEKVVAGRGQGTRGELAALRLKIVAARRFLGPQRDALGAIGRADLNFLDRSLLREIEEEYVRTTRIVEDMDELRDQALVLREEMAEQMTDRINRNMFLLSILTAIFLPLGFLTGLFGVNLAGLPGQGNDNAFLYLCTALGVLVVLQVLLLWLMRWIGRGG